MWSTLLLEDLSYNGTDRPMNLGLARGNLVDEIVNETDAIFRADPAASVPSRRRRYVCTSSKCAAEWE